MDTNQFCPKQRCMWEAAMVPIGPNSYKIMIPFGDNAPDVSHDRLYARERDRFYGKFEPYNATFDAAVKWLKDRNTVWPDLRVALKPLHRDWQSAVVAQTMPYLHGIEVDPSQPDRMDVWKGLVHEFKHVSQHTNGELSGDVKLVCFKHRLYPVDPQSMEASDTAHFEKYHSQPWEEEARAYAHKYTPDMLANLKAMGLPI